MKIPAAHFLLVLLLPLSLRAEGPKPLADDPRCTAVDRVFMERAYELAAGNVKKGERPFGAVLVVDGKIIAECTNKVLSTRDPTRHAELGLISTYLPKLDRETIRKSTLYTSSEPCIMCSGAIVQAGIPKVVYGVTAAQFHKVNDPSPPKHPVTCREIMARMDPKVVVLGPLMEKEGLAQHEAYWPGEMKRLSGK